MLLLMNPFTLETIRNLKISEHAAIAMEQRGISYAELAAGMMSPERIYATREDHGFVSNGLVFIVAGSNARATLVTVLLETDSGRNEGWTDNDVWDRPK